MKLKNLALAIGITTIGTISSFSTVGNIGATSLKVNTNTSTISAASDSTPSGFKYAKKRDDVYDPGAPKEYYDKFFNVTPSDFSDEELRIQCQAYMDAGYEVRNAKYEAICSGSSRGFDYGDDYYIFTEGFVAIGEDVGRHYYNYVLKATRDEYKKYYKELKRRNKTVEEFENYKNAISLKGPDGDEEIWLEYDEENEIMYEFTTRKRYF